MTGAAGRAGAACVRLDAADDGAYSSTLTVNREAGVLHTIETPFCCSRLATAAEYGNGAHDEAKRMCRD